MRIGLGPGQDQGAGEKLWVQSRLRMRGLPPQRMEGSFPEHLREVRHTLVPLRLDYRQVFTPPEQVAPGFKSGMKSLQQAGLGFLVPGHLRFSNQDQGRLQKGRMLQRVMGRKQDHFPQAPQVRLRAFIRRQVLREGAQVQRIQGQRSLPAGDLGEAGVRMGGKNFHLPAQVSAPEG